MWVRKDKQNIHIYIHTYIHSHTFRKTISEDQAHAWLKKSMLAEAIKCTGEWCYYYSTNRILDNLLLW